MPTRKLKSANAFVVSDLEDAETASGLVRCAPKILPSSAAELARSATYTFAAHGCKRGGASAGINAKGDQRDEAVRAFTDEIAEMAATGKFLPDAGRGMTEDDLRPLRAGDLRGEALFAEHEGMPLATYLQGVGAVAAAGAALGGLEDRTAALEGFGLAGLAAAKELEEQGAKVVAVSTGAGVAATPAGFSLAELSEAFASHSEEMVKHLRAGLSSGDSDAIWSTEADMFFAGSKIGAVDHNAAELFAPMALASLAPLAFTTKALVALQRKDAKVLPDFVCLGGPIYAEVPISPDDAIVAARASTAALVEDASGHPEGIFLGACAIAERFLLTWRDELPFGRPLAP